MGTLYRRFPTKEALIGELVRQQLSDVIRSAETARELPDGLGLESFLWRIGELLAAQRGCLSRLWTDANAEELVVRARELIAELLADGQRTRRIRSDAVPADVSIVIWSLVGVIETTKAAAPTAWRRALELSLAALAPSATALREAPPTQHQMGEIAGQKPS